MSQRRSSGEIINATLLEVFLAFVFVVLALASFERNTANAAVAARDSALVAAQQMRERAESAEIERDSVRRVFLSQFPPLCESQPVLKVTITSEAKWEVIARRRIGGLMADVLKTYSPTQFREEFTPLADSARTRGCKFMVDIVGTDRVQTRTYIAARRQVLGLFYPRDGYRAGVRQ
jgi:hypothetical protein